MNADYVSSPNDSNFVCAFFGFFVFLDFLGASPSRQLKEAIYHQELRLTRPSSYTARLQRHAGLFGGFEEREEAKVTLEVRTNHDLVQSTIVTIDSP